ncbi:MAG: LptA/OstA family protein [Spirochaetota bacterium]
MCRNLLITVLLILAAGQLLHAAENDTTERDGIRFSSDHTQAGMQEGEKTVRLAGNAWVETGSVRIEADTIELYGELSRFIRGTGGVFISDEKQQITLSANNILYDRRQQLLKADGWAEMEDKEHGIVARGAYLENRQTEGLTLIQIGVRLFKDTSDGLMVCMTDSAVYNSEEQSLELTGNSTVHWRENTYRAAKITLALESEEITMEGSVSGTIKQ